MSLYQLVYVSKRSPTLSVDVLNQIVRVSQTTNLAKGITGVLMCQGSHIMQLLEGEREAVETLFAHIAADPRHAEVQQLLLKPVKSDCFPNGA